MLRLFLAKNTIWHALVCTTFLACLATSQVFDLKDTLLSGNAGDRIAPIGHGPEARSQTSRGAQTKESNSKQISLIRVDARGERI